MGAGRVFEKLDKVNSEKEEVVFKIEYRGKVLHKTNIEIPPYANEVLTDEEISLYYFFKDMSNSLEEKITELHKKKMFDNLRKENGSTEGNDKG